MAGERWLQKWSLTHTQTERMNTIRAWYDIDTQLWLKIVNSIPSHTEVHLQLIILRVFVDIEKY